ncbi:signal peptidase I [Pseudactinotalea sp.]|uniref:signal peptidase I n=1 Tax=Pseudactinotalea sp. TaxID=1926260 RepID=UPI003B3B8449
MSTQAPDRAGLGACVTPADAPERPTAERTTARRVRSVLGWVLVAAAAILLWPAQWGGLTGLTIVSGHSMEPTYVTGDLVVTWRQSDYAPGDVVSSTVPEGQPGAGGHVIHRIITAEPTSAGTIYTTLGDNNPAADQWAIAADDITGAAILHVPGLGRFLGPAVLPIILAAALGGIVTVLLWSRPSEDDDGEPTEEVPAP